MMSSSFFLLLLAVVSASTPAAAPTADKMWLRFAAIPPSTLRNTYVSQLKDGVFVYAEAHTLAAPSALTQLHTAANELSTSLSSLLGIAIPVTCCSHRHPPSTTTLTVNVGSTVVASNTVDIEGYTLSPHLITALTPSGALYGVYRYLSYLQRQLPLPGTSQAPVISNPAMTHRMWDMWDQLTGDVTRGFAGDSIIWPYARWNNDVGPPPIQLFVAPCSDKDPFQSWSGALFDGTGQSSSMVNNGNGKCVTNQLPGGVQVTECKQTPTTTYWYNSTVQQISIGNRSTADKTCLDINHALGPDLDYYACHPLGARDYQNQQFDIESINATTATTDTPPTYRLKSISAANQCITLRNSFPPSPDTPDISYLQRWDMLLRFLKSTGINSLSINDVNACGLDTSLLSTPTLTNVTTNLKPALEKYAMTLYFSVCFASPTVLANITSNPSDPKAMQWW